eukprot:jgi/Psemu1/3969/gm1.3969_g
MPDYKYHHWYIIKKQKPVKSTTNIRHHHDIPWIDKRLSEYSPSGVGRTYSVAIKLCEEGQMQFGGSINKEGRIRYDVHGGGGGGGGGGKGGAVFNKKVCLVPSKEKLHKKIF